jgi:hypothetical protein
MVGGWVVRVFERYIGVIKCQEVDKLESDENLK